MRRGVALVCAVMSWALLPLAPAPALADRVGHADATDLDITLELSHPGPFRASLRGAPPRLAVELDAAMVPPTVDRAFRLHSSVDGLVRLETSLPGPMAIDRALMAAAPGGQGARLSIRLQRVSSRDFAMLTDRQDPADPAPVATAAVPRLTIALDPGHGGSDPGATHGALHEADLMLTFAHELKADLLRTTDFDVVLTRTEDRFVPLRARLAYARDAGADLFLSLHADGIERGSASGATVFTHGHGGAAPASLASAQWSDAVATSARGHAVGAPATPDTPYRSQDLAAAMIAAMAAAELPLYKHPRQEADFVVLRARDMPSVLVELGFLTEPDDRARIADPGWRARMAAALRRGVLRWAQRDASVAAVQLQ